MLSYLLVLVLTVAALASPPGVPSCTSAHDCNAPACLDCACKNGQCVCADGWSGAHCDTPFCTNRTAGCSGHGDCSATASDISCTCDPGWFGPRCACNITCGHGGEPNAACTTCEGCLGAWSGLHCETWDASVPKSTLAARLALLKNNSAEKLKADLAYNPICKSGQECVGWGIDATSGQTVHFPLLALDFGGKQQMWNGFKSATGVFVQGLSQPNFEVDTKTFPTFDDYKSYVTGDLWAGGRVRAGGYTTNLTVMYKTEFQHERDSSLAITQAVYDLYKMHLIEDPSKQSRYQLEMDVHARSALEGLGPWEHDYASWMTFFESWGTSVAISSSTGGIQELWKYPSTVLNNYSQEWLDHNAACDAKFAMRVPGITRCPGDAESIFRKYDSPGWWWHRCLGGDPATCPLNDYPAKASSYQQWLSTLGKTPQLTKYEIMPLDEFILDEATASTFVQARTAYVAEKIRSWPTTGCPPTCQHNGTCVKGETVCSCYREYDMAPGPCYSGRACSVLNYHDWWYELSVKYSLNGAPYLQTDARPMGCNMCPQPNHITCPDLPNSTGWFPLPYPFWPWIDGCRVQDRSNVGPGISASSAVNLQACYHYAVSPFDSSGLVCANSGHNEFCCKLNYVPNWPSEV
jgi:hypothetical protein